MHKSLALPLALLMFRNVDEGGHDAIDPVIGGAIGKHAPDEILPPSLSTSVSTGTRSLSTFRASDSISDPVTVEARSRIGRPTSEGINRSTCLIGGVNQRIRQSIS